MDSDKWHDQLFSKLEDKDWKIKNKEVCGTVMWMDTQSGHRTDGVHATSSPHQRSTTEEALNHEVHLNPPVDTSQPLLPTTPLLTQIQHE